MQWRQKWRNSWTSYQKTTCSIASNSGKFAWNSVGIAEGNTLRVTTFLLCNFFNKRCSNINLVISDLVFSTDGHIFLMSCQVNYCCHWNTAIWSYERICLIMMYHSVSHHFKWMCDIGLYNHLCLAHFVHILMHLEVTHCHETQPTARKSQVVSLSSTLLYMCNHSDGTHWISEQKVGLKYMKYTMQKSHTNPYSKKK